MRILVIGGAGNAGQEIVRLLLKEKGHTITIGGRNIEKGRKAIDALDDSGSLSFIVTDTGNPGKLADAFKAQDLVIIASSSTTDAMHVATAAIETNTHYLDIQLSFPYKLECLQKLEKDILAKGLTFITDGGFHPGVPSLLIRYAGKKFDEVKKANVGSLIKVDWSAYSFSDNTIFEFIDEFRYYESKALRGGQIKKTHFSPPISFNFSLPYGKKPCNAMWLEELQAMPGQFPSLSDCGFYVGGFNWFTDYIMLPIVLGATKINPTGEHKMLARLFAWSLKRFNRPPYFTELILDAAGEKSGEYDRLILKLRHTDAYFLTAAPVVAALRQFFENPEANPGLWFQGHFPEPIRFLDDLRKMGVEIDEQFL